MKNIGLEFIQKTNDKYVSISKQRQGVIQPPIEMSYDESKTLIDLVDIDKINIPNINFIDVLKNRKSIREYSNNSISIMELSFLLWSTQGVKKIISKQAPNGQINFTFRTVPSAGARHPFETFLLINNVEGIKSGLYRYIATKHKLLVIDTSIEISQNILKACYNQEFLLTSAVSFIWVADSLRTTWRYSERGIRYILLDAGHVCENLYLASEVINCGCCAVGSFDDGEINKLLGLTSEETFVTYIGTVGKK